MGNLEAGTLGRVKGIDWDASLGGDSVGGEIHEEHTQRTCKEYVDV